MSSVVASRLLIRTRARDFVVALRPKCLSESVIYSNETSAKTVKNTGETGSLPHVRSGVELPQDFRVDRLCSEVVFVSSYHGLSASCEQVHARSKLKCDTGARDERPNEVLHLCRTEVAVTLTIEASTKA